MFWRMKTRSRGVMTAQERTEFADKMARDITKIVEAKDYKVLRQRINNALIEDMDQRFTIEW